MRNLGCIFCTKLNVQFSFSENYKKLIIHFNFFKFKCFLKKVKRKFYYKSEFHPSRIENINIKVCKSILYNLGIKCDIAKF